MTHKIALYYVVKVQEGRTPDNTVVKNVEYLAGPYGSYGEELIDKKHELEDKGLYFHNTYLEIATQYIEVEI